MIEFRDPEPSQDDGEWIIQARLGSLLHVTCYMFCDVRRQVRYSANKKAAGQAAGGGGAMRREIMDPALRSRSHPPREGAVC